MTEIYRTTVRGVGSGVADFADQGLFLLFGENAPANLAEYCYTIDVTATSSDILAGQSLNIDGQSYRITAVGDVVRKNLDGLGHISINFDGSNSPTLGGTLHITGDGMPSIGIGSVITIEEA